MDFSILDTINLLKKIKKKDLKLIDKIELDLTKEVTRLILTTKSKRFNWSPKFKGKRVRIRIKTNEWFSKNENIKLYKINLYNV